MLKPKIKEKIKIFCRKTPLFLAKKAFFVFLIFSLFVLILDVLLFYFYLWRIEQKEIKITPKEIEINQNIYDQFLQNYSQKEKKFRQVEKEEYIDIFFR
jgi:uncharacterized membrane protein